MNTFKNIVCNNLKLTCAVVAVLFLGLAEPAQAGWTGLINGAGVGWASVNVRSSAFVTNRVTTVTNLTSPSAAMAPTTGYKTNAPLPSGAATNTYARIKGLAGGIWQAALNAANSGDGTDNPELDSRVAITPADCAAITFGSLINQSQSEFSSNGFSGTITVDASATAGTALWLRGFEYTNDMADLPPDDPNTVQNETIEYLKTHGAVVFETLLVGPFEFGGSNNCPLIIPFNLASGNLNNLIFATDATAKSNPLQIGCPGNIVVTCGQPVVYNPVYYSACGDVTVTFNPPQGSYFPVGTTPVLVTVADQNGNSTNCTFTVTVMDLTAPVVPVLPVLTGQAFVQVPTPTTIDVCGTTTNIITGTTTDPTFYNTQGTNIVHWRFNDGNGNTSTANQTVIVKDTMPPATPVLSTITGQCSATVTPPTTTDTVAGTITGTTTDPLTYATQGTFTVHWTFSDGNGNSTTANQTVMVKDTVPPVAPVLPTITANCSGPAVLTAPTTTDNCAGTVTGTTTDPLAYSSTGTNIVHWTFSDGHGNTNTANQTVIVTGITFQGFYSPIGAVSNACTSPVIINQGSVSPIKFDILCGSAYITGGQPPVVKIQLWNNCSFVSEPVSVNAVYQNNWHYNWDTTNWAKGIYKVIVIMPDSTQRYVFVKLK
jgi:hypothetical protein